MDGTIESAPTGGSVRPLETEIATYEANKARLERDFPGQWIVIKGTEIVGHYGTVNDAAEEGLRRFRGESFLLRQIGASSEVVLPASVVHAQILA